VPFQLIPVGMMSLCNVSGFRTREDMTVNLYDAQRHASSVNCLICTVNVSTNTIHYFKELRQIVMVAIHLGGIDEATEFHYNKPIHVYRFIR
jgi:hypothetical protein